MDVSVIIVNYNTKSLIKDCIQSILDQTKGIEYEIIVVDNNSIDGSQDMIKKHFSNVILIESKENLGFGKANNLGSNIAKGKYLFYLNSDTILSNNALRIFYDYAEQSKLPIGALGCILKGTNGDNCHSYGNFITIKSELKNSLGRYLRFLKDSDHLNPPSIDSIKDVDYITGADLFVPKSVYDSIGGFDPIFFMYCEEADWEFRMEENGLKRFIIPGPEIVHLEGGSDPSKSHIWSANRLKNFYRSKRIYMRKHNSYPKYISYRFLYLMLQIPINLTLALTKRGDYISLLKHL